jgi:hypothetical protein
MFLLLKIIALAILGIAAIVIPLVISLQSTLCD